MGIFYDPEAKQLKTVEGSPEPGWMLVTHNVHAGLHHCRRIMREWLTAEELSAVDCTGIEAGRSSLQ